MIKVMSRMMISCIVAATQKRKNKNDGLSVKGEEASNRKTHAYALLISRLRTAIFSCCNAGDSHVFTTRARSYFGWKNVWEDERTPHIFRSAIYSVDFSHYRFRFCRTPEKGYCAFENNYESGRNKFTSRILSSVAFDAATLRLLFLFIYESRSRQILVTLRE